MTTHESSVFRQALTFPTLCRDLFCALRQVSIVQEVVRYSPSTRLIKVDTDVVNDVKALQQI